ncbi:MAG: hypothetical protein WC548_01460 [Candidatus Pacearchaeota archaeon]
MENHEYDLKLEYNKVKEKFKLPIYSEMAEDFDIEKLAEKESEYLVREIRRAIVEKLAGYMHFFELLINPASSPLFIFSVLKSIDKKTRDKINSIYKKFSKFQIESMKLDTIYNEENEAKFIRDFFKEWQILKKEIHKIIEMFEANIDESSEEKRSGYFG